MANKIDKSNIVKVKNMFDEQLSDDTLRRPMTPSSWAGFEREAMTIVEVTHGGGMGGAHRKFYCVDIPFDRFTGPTQMVEIETLDGEKYLINKDYIVVVNSNYDCFRAYLDSKNPNYQKGMYEYKYKVLRNSGEITLADW